MAKKAPARRPAAAGRTRPPAGGRTTKAAASRGGAARKTAGSRGAGKAKPVGRSAAATARQSAAATAGAKKTANKKQSANKKPVAVKRAVKKTVAKKTVRPAAARSSSAKAVKRPAAKKVKPAAKTAARRSAPPRREGGTGDERTLAQTPDTGRSVDGPTNPMPTRRSTDTPAGAGDLSHNPDLERSLRDLRLVEELVPSPPSTLDMDRSASAARTGAEELQDARMEHTETGPELTGGDVDASWEDASTVGDEAPGGDNPTPDQDIVDDIGKALGVVYEDNEELKGADKIIERDRHRWELDPASSEDYKERE